MEQFRESNGELNESYVQRKPVDDKALFPADEYPQLKPYRSLTVKRLKPVGEGKWPMEKFLTGPFWLPFPEPKFLEHSQPDDHTVWPSFKCEKREENFELAMLWESSGLLRLHHQPLGPDHFCKVFNAYKGPAVDRQIGDRRVPNSPERSIDGPSHHPPPSFLLTNWRTEPFVEKVLGSVTDRRDFCHQAEVTEECARSNMLPFSFPQSSLMR